MFFLNMKVIVTIPAHNEQNTIGPVIKQIHLIMKKHDYSYEILVVDDGSRDNTASLAKSMGATVISHPRKYGLAETFNTEMDYCVKEKADIIVHIDADGQYKPEEIPRLIEALKEGNDLVLGSRFKGKIESMSLLKKFGNKAFSRVVSNITKLKITDAQTGFRAFTKEVAKLPITSLHTYTQEQIIRAVKHKFRVKEVPVFFAKRTKGKSRLLKNPFEYATKAWITIFRLYRDYEPLRFFGLAGSFFIFFGLVIGLFIVYHIITTGNAGGVPRVILSALLILTGAQIVFFGFLADMQRTHPTLPFNRKGGH